MRQARKRPSTRCHICKRPIEPNENVILSQLRVPAHRMCAIKLKLNWDNPMKRHILLQFYMRGEKKERVP